MIEIQQAHLQDHHEITDVWEASVRATHHFLKEEDIVFFRPLILNQYLGMVNLFCIRDKGGRIQGFIGTLEDKVEMLFIHPDTRGKGVGKALLKFAVDELRVKKVDVNEQNEQAVGFYEHFGFYTNKRSDVDSLGKPYPILHMELQ